ncbi:MAG TPA: zinc metalloprotease HtpX [Gemmatimonadales bacterium]
MNNTKVFVLLAGLAALFGAIGGALGGEQGMIMALIIAAVMNVGLYFTSGSLVLRMYGAREVTAADAPELYALVDRLRQRAGLPMPRVAIAAQRQPNAFATGRNPSHAVLCVTEGLLSTVGGEELAGVLGHEIGHIKNHDMLLQTISATMAAAIVNLARFGAVFGGRRERGERVNPFATLAMLVLGPLGAMLLQLAISRQREFKADATGATLTGNPLALAGALAKLEAGAREAPMDVSPAVAPLAQVNPLGASGFTRLFSTHPPITERIERLEAMAARAPALV